MLHVAGRLQDDRTGGAAKLNKVLFFAEFTHLRRHHRVISGCEFQKLPHGPAPRQLLPVRQRLIESGAAELLEEDFLGRPQHRLVPSRAANLDVFTNEELQTIEDVLDQLDGMTGTHLVHDDGSQLRSDQCQLRLRPPSRSSTQPHYRRAANRPNGHDSRSRTDTRARSQRNPVLRT